MIKNAILYVNFDGTCGDALEFYKKTLDAKIIERYTFSEAGFDAVDKDKGLIAHAIFTIANNKFAVADNYAVNENTNLQQGNNMSIYLDFKDVDSLEKTFEKLVVNGAKEIVKLFDAPWGARYGKVIDPFGVYFELMYNY